MILGGTSEATALAQAVYQAGLRGTISFAGRVARPVRQPLPTRIGGFGGAAGLAEYLHAQAVSHVIDATHPFASQMSHNAMAACAAAKLPLIALTRPPWQADQTDLWSNVANIEAAVRALNRPACRVMLAIGRMHLDAFAPNPQHFYLLRLVDPPKTPPPFPDHTVCISRGPFTLRDDLALMRQHRIDLVVSKNAGGTGAFAKIKAARQLQLPVIMIDRPKIAHQQKTHSPKEVLQWVSQAGSFRHKNFQHGGAHGNTERGV